MKITHDFKKIMHDANLKCTAPRELVIALLYEKHLPLSAQDIFEQLKKKNTIDLATVYRTLASFEKAGLVKRIDLRTDTVLYELNTLHHHHIVCTHCGRVEDFDLCEVDRLMKKVASQSSHFNVVSEHTLEFFGVCTACTS